MPTENRRVATYLPKHIDDRLKAFISERNLKGDSPALIAILSEFFGMSQEVAHFNEVEIKSLSSQFEDLSLKVAHLENELLGNLKNSPLGDLKNELLSELQGELFDRLKPDLRNELLSELKSELSNITPVQQPEPDVLKEVEGQLSFLETPSVADLESDSLSDLLVDQAEELQPSPLEPMNGRDLASRFGVYKDTVNGRKLKLTPELFGLWSKEKDPDNISWQYSDETKLYHPILPQQEHLDSEEF